MIGLPSLAQLDRTSSVRIWWCTGPTDMRRGFDRLAEQARGTAPVNRGPPPQSACL
jgi:hypothetical protein